VSGLDAVDVVALGLAIVVVPIVIVLFRIVDQLAQRRLTDRMLAKGTTLDRLGAVYGMRRKPRERDVDYRERISRSVSNVHKRDDWT